MAKATCVCPPKRSASPHDLQAKTAWLKPLVFALRFTFPLSPLAKFHYLNRMKNLILPLVILLAACSRETPPDVSGTDAWFTAMSQQCGNAYPGKLTLAPPGDDMLTGTEMLVVHFRECSDSLLKAPFHIEIEADNSWNRSRTWIFTHHGNNIELRHDHRKPDGSDDAVTMYGGFTIDEGSAVTQIFKSVPRSEETGQFRGWRIEIEPGIRYTYGTVRDSLWSWRIDFDLSEAIEPPPPPWGHE